MYGSLEYYNILKENFFNEQIKLGFCKEDKERYNRIIFSCYKDANFGGMENLILFNSDLNFSFVLTYEDLFYKIND